MPPDDDSSPHRWLSGFGSLEWRSEERGYAALLDALTRDRIGVEALEREREATSRRSLAELHEDQQRAARDELAEARRELHAFRVAIEDVRQRGGSSDDSEVPYDSADETQNQAADMLIQYLVRPDYAEVRTEEPEPGHYVYYVRVNWPRLRALSEAHGHALAL